MNTDWEVLYYLSTAGLFSFTALLTWMACEFPLSPAAQRTWAFLWPWRVHVIAGGLIATSFLMGWLMQGFVIGLTVTALTIWYGILGGLVGNIIAGLIMVTISVREFINSL